MFKNNIKQNAQGLWIIRPTAESTGCTLYHYEMPITISTSSSDYTRRPPEYGPVEEKCYTLNPIVFPNEKILNVDLTKQQLSCYIDNVTLSASFGMHFQNLVHGCDPTYSWAAEYVFVYLEYKDHLGNDLGIVSNICGGSLSGVGRGRIVSHLYSFNILADGPSPRYLGAIIPKARWYGGGGSFSITGNLVFQYISCT
jgi:hypothetical protein